MILSGQSISLQEKRMEKDQVFKVPKERRVINTVEGKRKKRKKDKMRGGGHIRIMTPKLFLGLHFPVQRHTAETMWLAL